MEPLKRISPLEAKNYIELSIYDPKLSSKAIAFTLTPEPDPVPTSLTGRPWERVTYYADETSIGNEPLYPLEILHREWSSLT